MCTVYTVLDDCLCCSDCIDCGSVAIWVNAPRRYLTKRIDFLDFWSSPAFVVAQLKVPHIELPPRLLCSIYWDLHWVFLTHHWSDFLLYLLLSPTQLLFQVACLNAPIAQIHSDREQEADARCSHSKKALNLAFVRLVQWLPGLSHRNPSLSGQSNSSDRKRYGIYGTSSKAIMPTVLLLFTNTLWMYFCELGRIKPMLARKEWELFCMIALLLIPYRLRSLPLVCPDRESIHWDKPGSHCIDLWEANSKLF